MSEEEREELREEEGEGEKGIEGGGEGERGREKCEKEEEKGEAECSIPPSSRLPITMSQKLVVTKPSSATHKIAS